VRHVAVRTCGGTLLQADGSPSVDCTQAESACAGRAPCVAVYGAGNAGRGTISCGASVPFNCEGLSCCPAFPGFTDAGEGLLYLSSALSSIVGACSGSDPSDYGADGVFCTDDDPGAVRLNATVTTDAYTTGTASVGICGDGRVETSNESIVLPDPLSCTATGRPFSCAAGRVDVGHACLAAAEVVTGPAFGEVAVADQLCGRTAPQPTPTSVATPAGCLGDCNGDRGVSVDEIITLVNIALGVLPSSACAGSDWVCGHLGSDIVIPCIISAVGNALHGCPPSSCGGFAGVPCGSNEACDIRDPSCAIADASGTCVASSGICPLIVLPVCGCDGVTYQNDCYRLNAGATLKHAGDCP
jgi:hypothetical protein